MWCSIVAVAICCAVPDDHIPAIAERRDEARLNQLLKTWEVQSHFGKVIQIDFHQFIYQTVFQDEKQGTGRLILGENTYWVDVTPVDYAKDQKSRRDGFKLLPYKHETWIGGSGRTMQLNHEHKQMDVYHWIEPTAKPEEPKPEANRGYFSNWTPPDFLGMTVPSFIRVRAEDLHKRFNVSLRQDTLENAIFELEPRDKPEKLNWSSILVIWSHAERRVHAVKLIDSGRTTERVFVIKDYVIDPPLDLKEVMNPTYPGYYRKEHKPQ